MSTTFLIEIRPPNSRKHWIPVGVINTEQPLGSVDLISQIRTATPQLQPYEIQLRLFRKIAGAYASDPAQHILVLVDSDIINNTLVKAKNND